MVRRHHRVGRGSHGTGGMTTVRHLLIPAAGLGTRMRAVDAKRPKELLPLNGKPAICYTVAEGIDAGVERVSVTVPYPSIRPAV